MIVYILKEYRKRYNIYVRLSNTVNQLPYHKIRNAFSIRSHHKEYPDKADEAYENADILSLEEIIERYGQNHRKLTRGWKIKKKDRAVRRVRP